MPYTRVHPEARSSLPAGSRLVDVSESDDAYWKLLSDLWSKGEPFTIVEHDIVADPETLAAIDGCAEAWCAASYRFEAWPALYGMGCTKFGSRAMLAVPDALDRVGRMADDVHPARHWCALDARLFTVLYQAGLRRHEHGHVIHLSEQRSHGCH